MDHVWCDVVDMTTCHLLLAYYKVLSCFDVEEG
jgi:hypothetical protein